MKSLKAKYFIFSSLFFVSGVTGLVYEAVWTQYLKILTGHAAFAQSFILILFLSGLASGAWFGSKILNRVKNLFIFYAILETGIGLFALSFHVVFVQVNQFLFETLYPDYNQKWVDVLKWLFSIILTLPPTMLLGSTFPVLVHALEKVMPKKKTKMVSHLYFLNSLGASLGVLVSGFFLTEEFGLPVSMTVSGLVNIAIGMLTFLVVLLIKNFQQIKSDDFNSRNSVKQFSLPALSLQNSTFTFFLTLAALITGATSFIYEIGWIRMLSMTLGSSTHSFELMLSAFILGLALGSVWIKYKIVRIKNIVAWFAVVQVSMGVFAMLSILGYNAVFDLMTWMLESLQRNENGFLLYLTGSHLIALLVMLPATIFAGMSLPLIIFMMQQMDLKNDAVGKIYAIDTAGGILGVLVAIHLLLPFFGIKYLMIIAGSLDILIGIMFFMTQTKFRKTQFLVLAFTGFFFLILTVIFFINPDSQKMASGVFRYGNIGHSKNIIFEKDGKTASIAVFETQKGNIVLTTNGKPDASVNIYRQITGDEATQVLLAALPLSFNYQPEKVGIIGLGCGKTAHTALTNFNIRQLDVVEIEPVVYEAAGFFKNYVGNIFIDSRFELHLNDARTFFTITKNQYDIIISEPSNPWVSGVGSLFSIEFYDLISKKLNDNGIFVQWVQSYEMTVPLVASIVKSFSPFFQDYEVFFMDDGDLAFICKKYGNLHADYTKIFENVELKHELARIGIENSHDLKIRLIGNKELLDPFFNSYLVSANSDYYPFLEYQAAKAGFLQLSASGIEQLISFPAPIIYSLMKNDIPDGELVGLNPPYQMGERFRNAEAVFSFFNDKKDGYSPEYENMDEESVLLINTIRHIENRKDSLNFSISWTPFLSTFAKVVQPFLPGEKLDVIWDYIQNADGFPFLPEKIKQQVLFYQAVGNRDYEKIINLSDKTSFDDISLAFPDTEYYFACRIWAFLMLSKQEEAIKLWESYPYKSNPSMILRLLGNLTVKRVDSLKTQSKTPNLLK